MIGKGGGRLPPIRPRRKCTLDYVLDMDGGWPARADEGGACADNLPPTTVTRFVGGGI